MNRSKLLPAPGPARYTKSVFVALIICLGAVGSLSAQDVLYDAIAIDNVSSAQIESAIDVIELRQGLDEETRGLVTQYLWDAQAHVLNRLGAEATAAQFAGSLDTAPDETAALRLSLDEESPAPPTAESLGVNENTTLAELEQRLAQEGAQLAAVESQLAVLKAGIEKELDRPAQARQRIGQLRKRAEEDLASAVRSSELAGEQQIVINARNLSAQLKRAAENAEIKQLEQELLSHAVRLRLLQAQRDVAARTQLQLNARVNLLRDAVNAKLQSVAVEAQATAAAARLAMADKHPALRDLAEDNAALTQELPQRAAVTRALSGQLEQIKNEVDEMQQRLARSERRLEIGGLNRALGSLLIAERRSLPSLAQYRAEISTINREAAKVGLDRIRVQEQRRELASLDQAVQNVIADLKADISDPEELAANEREVRPLLRDRRELLLQIENSYGNYLHVLGDMDVEHHRLLDSTTRYQEFLAKHLVWIPSASIFGVAVFRDGLPDIPHALLPQSWTGVATQLADSLGQHFVESLLCLALLFFLVLINRPLTRQYTLMNARVGRLSSDSIMLTFASLGIVAIRAVPIPFLALSIAWFLNTSAQPTTFSDSVARCLFLITPFIYNVILFRGLSAPEGIFRLHFGWKQKYVDVIRRQLHRLAVIGTPLIFITALLFLSELQSDRATGGRLAFIVLMFFLASVIRPILHPETGIVADYYQRFPGTWSARLRWLWFSIGIGIPLILALVSSLGFLYTSTILTGLLVANFWRVLALVVLYLVVLRWLALAKRRLALQIAIKDRETRRDEKHQDLDAEVPLDLDEVDQQTKKMLRSVAVILAIFITWSTWAQILPAFSFLDDVSLWTQTVMIDGIATVQPVTLLDLIAAILVIVVTVIASRNLPGFLEILFLQRLDLQPGSRYAINTLARYVVVAIGTISVLSMIGWNWSQIQWLVAALSVGLGFGLQEIVANFVSGLIILFERPVRVGDTVTVGQLTGTVSRVRIRATTITDWDRKEILVPNKAFINEQVVNWTLSDPITRVVIPVGVAYGSDPDLTCKVMSDTLKSLPLVLDEPPSKVYFTGFGDSSLNFTLHAYLRQLSDRLPLVHEVHEAILKALRENGIKIPFPQRDVHVHSALDDK